MRWAVNRLRRMSAAELAWRVRKMAKAHLEKKGIGLAPVVAPTPFTQSGAGNRVAASASAAATTDACAATAVKADTAAIAAAPDDTSVWGRSWLEGLENGLGPDVLGIAALDAQAYRCAADRIMQGTFDVFALHGAELGFPPRWNRDPKTGTEAALVFGKTLDYRNPVLVGDIKYLWEPNRHYELVTLAQAFHLTRDERYADACLRLLDSWFAACPYPLGQGWSSALENAIRLTNWSVAWHLLGGASASMFDGAAGAAFRQRWLASIHQHCHFIAGHLSRHSSANNHLLGECMGLFIGATTWPCWNASRTWQRDAHDEFERQALCQNATDGVNREQAIWYQHEVADMMLLCGMLGRANGIAFAESYWSRLAAMLSFIDALMDRNGNVPMIGDSDDAVMVRLSQQADFHPYRSLLACGAVLFGRIDFKSRARRFDHKSRWLLGQAGADAFAALAPLPGKPALPTPRRCFAEGGYYLLGDAFDTDREIRIVADAGALGYLSIAAHGHADALSLTLSAGGQPLLIDPGTFAYHTEAKWRRYFRGTSAHNTVRVDGVDQSVQGGNFMWLQHARAHCEHWQVGPERDCFIGSHDGYRRLRDPVRHRRKITFDKAAGSLIVEDSFDCNGAHELEWHWHLDPACTASIEAGATVSVRCGLVAMRITLPDTAGVLILASGQEEPPLGWTSDRFDVRRPSPSVVWRERICGSSRRTTVFHITLPSPPIMTTTTD